MLSAIIIILSTEAFVTASASFKSRLQEGIEERQERFERQQLWEQNQPGARYEQQQQLAEQKQALLGEKVIPSSNTSTRFIDDTGLTINHVPAGWTLIDHNNTSPEQVAFAQEAGSNRVATFCPPCSKADTSAQQFFHTCSDPSHGQVLIRYYLSMDKHEYFVPRAIVINPDTGLLELNLTAQNILDYNISPVWDMIVQNKTVPINVTLSENGTNWQVPGLLVLITSPDNLELKRVGLYFVDYTTGYEIIVNGPLEIPEPFPQDPRGEPIPIHGIGLDNLPTVMAEPMQIINSVSITRR